MVIIAGGNVHAGSGSTYRLVPWPVGHTPLHSADARAQPSLLLKADNGVVDFHGREREKADFLKWRERAGRVRIRLLHGGGGQGKTRFADHLARNWREDGWIVWAAPDPAAPDRSGAFNDERLPGVTADGEGTALRVRGARGVLIVVDYADRWNGDVLVTLLELAHTVQGAPVRIVLVSRQLGPWWQKVESLFIKRGAVCDTMRLGPHSPEPEQRPGEFELARACFAAALGRSPGGGGRPGSPGSPDGPYRPGSPPRPHDWRLPAYDLVLTIHMAALVSVLAELDGDEAPSDPLQISRYLLGRERLHWDVIDRRRGRPETRQMDIAVFVATLTGGLPSHAQGARALGRLGLSASESRDLTDSHALCYPVSDRPGDGSSGNPVLEPLYPDLLGEDFLALTIPGHGMPYPAYPAAETFVAELLAPDPTTGEAPPWARHALTTLIEVSRRWAHVARGQLYPLLEEHPGLAVAAGGGVLSALADLATDNEDLLRLVRSRMPAQRGVDLEVGAHALAERLTEYDAEHAVSGPELARLHERRARLGSRTGRREKALSESGSAVAVWRRLVERNAAAHTRDLGRALATHAECQAKVGLTDRASETVEEALMLLRSAGDAPGARPDLAYALRNAAGVRYRAGRRTDAIAAASESVELFRALQRDRPRHLADLAGTLTLLCGLLIAEERLAESVAAGEESARILDGLVKDHHGLEPEQSQAHSELARALARSGSLRRALSHGSRAVVVRRRLAQASFPAFGPRLAVSLMNVAACHADLDAYVDAVVLGREGLATFERCLEEGLPVHAATRTAAETLSEILDRAGHYANADELRLRYGVDGFVDGDGPAIR